MTLNSTTVSNFNDNTNGIKTTFIASVAAAAGVSLAQVIIISVEPYYTVARRLLSTMINVVTRIEGAQQKTQRRSLLSPDHNEWSVRPPFMF
jgi:hypothetical protein